MVMARTPFGKYRVDMNGTQVLVCRVPLGELLLLARRAAFCLDATDAVLADALRGVAAEVELTTYDAEDSRVCC